MSSRLLQNDQDTEAELAGDVTVSLDVELTVTESMTEAELATLVLEALESDDRVTLDFACTTTSDS